MALRKPTIPLSETERGLIRTYMIRGGYTQKDIGDKIGGGQPRISCILRGSHRPSAEEAKNLYEALGSPEILSFLNADPNSSRIHPSIHKYSAEKHWEEIFRGYNERVMDGLSSLSDPEKAAAARDYALLLEKYFGREISKKPERARRKEGRSHLSPTPPAEGEGAKDGVDGKKEKA